MTGTQYQAKAMRTAGTADKNSLLLNGVMGLNGEAGECIDIVKKHVFQGHELDKKKLLDEMSDVMWYMAILAEAIDTTLDAVMAYNVAKLEMRYPDGFSVERSVNRE